MPARRFDVSPSPLSLDALTGAVTAASREPNGAISSFVGLVRGHNLGRQVRFLEYEAYEPLVLKAFARIEEETAGFWPTVTLGVHHRTGHVDVGDASIAIVAASPHRAAAFAACRYVIERVKQIVPIWKHEHFADGDAWIEGATVDPDDQQARDTARRLACE